MAKKGSWKQLSGGATTGGYAIDIKTYDVVGAYYGSMTADDWLQLTFRASGTETVGTGTSKVTTPLLEYPVMEMRLTDGVVKANNYQPIVVAVMDRTGSRHGRDGVDAVHMRKAMSSGGAWYN